MSADATRFVNGEPNVTFTGFGVTCRRTVRVCPTFALFACFVLCGRTTRCGATLTVGVDELGARAVGAECTMGTGADRVGAAFFGLDEAGAGG
jgi:hypothetical protein